LGVVIVALVAVSLAGCVRRRMTIRSEPSGALVSVDDREIGMTPISTNFTYYGARKIRLVKDGYETLTVMQPIPTPWYEIPPLDFISENFVPGEVQDRRTLSYQLRPQVVVPTEQLRGRAEELRAKAQPPVAALPSTLPTAPPLHRLPPSGVPSALPEPIPAPPGQPSSIQPQPSPAPGAWAAPPITPAPGTPSNAPSQPAWPLQPPAWEQ
jgi:hypothetical protein